VIPIGDGSGPDHEEMPLSEPITILGSLGLTQADLARATGASERSIKTRKRTLAVRPASRPVLTSDRSSSIHRG
jgi:hypothetical protein